MPHPPRPDRPRRGQFDGCRAAAGLYRRAVAPAGKLRTPAQIAERPPQMAKHGSGPAGDASKIDPGSSLPAAATGAAPGFPIVEYEAEAPETVVVEIRVVECLQDLPWPWTLTAYVVP